MGEIWYPDDPETPIEEERKAAKAKIKARLSNLNIVYKRQMSGVVDIYIGNEGDELRSVGSGKSQYLALYVVRTDTGDVVKLRMRTVRNIVQFLFRKKFIPQPRRLWLWEKIKPGWL